MLTSPLQLAAQNRSCSLTAVSIHFGFFLTKPPQLVWSTFLGRQLFDTSQLVNLLSVLSSTPSISPIPHPMVLLPIKNVFSNSIPALIISPIPHPHEGASPHEGISLGGLS